MHQIIGHAGESNKTNHQVNSSIALTFCEKAQRSASSAGSVPYARIPRGKMKAAFVEGTNLVMVWIIQDKTSDNCYDETQCPKVEPSEVPFGFEKVPPLDPSEKCTGIPHRKPSRSRSMCYNSVHEIHSTVLFLGTDDLPLLSCLPFAHSLESPFHPSQCHCSPFGAKLLIALLAITPFRMIFSCHIKQRRSI
ncbi:hypothetical protein TELCIR_03841 [Teladorsagia circumcincta]|uniref:Uncharacterized protein n=1 Tax=Teladorsagia circumcincta TaxID=45464 RepID=A0A2G9UV78_TELCI|nr:hypothetical protein TELCIR_03841 [Teladorsagia circumcincta]